MEPGFLLVNTVPYEYTMKPLYTFKYSHKKHSPDRLTSIVQEFLVTSKTQQVIEQQNHYFPITFKH